jgi:hypothetical protein
MFRSTTSRLFDMNGPFRSSTNQNNKPKPQQQLSNPQVLNTDQKLSASQASKKEVNQAYVKLFSSMMEPPPFEMYNSKQIRNNFESYYEKQKKLKLEEAVSTPASTKRPGRC